MQTPVTLEIVSKLLLSHQAVKKIHHKEIQAEETEKPGSDADTEGKTSESGGGSVTTVTTTSKGTSLSLVFPLLTLLSSLSFIFSNS
ncbi:unnamed protein product [Hymenolepis diminuta]|uniref:Uncharacterized protein n=1 Tax=Hymenolepis diminuta TaxID=6216 RepID=A0A564XYC4_HYMDI|nr:unnamed protein product [Hymenolepis diminuta]